MSFFSAIRALIYFIWSLWWRKRKLITQASALWPLCCPTYLYLLNFHVNCVLLYSVWIKCFFFQLNSDSLLLSTVLLFLQEVLMGPELQLFLTILSIYGSPILRGRFEVLKQHFIRPAPSDYRLFPNLKKPLEGKEIFDHWTDYIHRSATSGWVEDDGA